MSTAHQPHSGHLVARTVSCVQADLDATRDAALWTLGAAETGALLLEATRARARLAELELRLAAHAAALDVGAEVGATSTASWWAHQTRLTRAETHRLTRLGRDLEADHHQPVRRALADGAVTLDQTAVIVHAVDELPADLVDAETRVRAEEFLLSQAADHDAITLRRLGKRLIEVAAPEHADAAEGARLEAEEAKARATTRLTMTDDGHGRTHGRFTLPSHHAAMLRKALLALAAPRHQAAVHGPGPAAARRPSAERLGAAFCEYVERYPADRLPTTGGVNATVVVTMPLESLLGGLRAAFLDTGETISASEARRLACEAGIVPVVLGGDSQPLDVGRERRYYTRAQRIAMGLRDGGCVAEGCDWPPGLCHAHHWIRWADLGDTSLENGALLCPRHHARAHDPGYQLTRLPGGKVAFHRRT